MSIKKFPKTLSSLISYVLHMKTLNITYIIQTLVSKSNYESELMINYNLFFVKEVNNV